MGRCQDGIGAFSLRIADHQFSPQKQHNQTI